MNLNFRQLEVFRAVMIAKTISGAAEILNVSQPGISRLLKYMEYKMGIALFERSKGRLIPTPEGLELFREVEPIYQRIEGLEDTIGRIIRGDNLQFHIGCTPSLSNVVAPWLFAEIKKVMPDVMLKLETLPNEAMAEYVSQRRIDFAIALGEVSHPLVQADPSTHLRLQVVLPEDHPLASREQLTFEDIAGHPIVNYFPETLLGQAIRDGFEEIGKEPQTAVMVRYADDACAMAEQRLGLTVALEYTAIPGRYPGLVSVPLGDVRQSIYFVRHNEVSMSNHLRNCFETAQSKLAEIHTSLLT
ncbi:MULTISPECIES: LysR family transcriptional regulator [Alteromonas]|uniref:HTH lysR-type domain-containing protein n=1 Tax=Alteromonas confluentis TaxID=1656094 RepID=A0A1E7ZCK7_9ALTE|nr:MULTISPECIES: LysR family transcriptional regulator [Alteromonas]AYA65587.1 LysR family transcriptional regulator [Alteromonas sp. RKMC-009]MDO6474520.1 LysR family transcriptional regulator [Alteromonas sp. 1_MG-2023]OFC71192.1 hypothetical protein BFC18_08485 [Alteromonas confluentis]